MNPQSTGGEQSPSNAVNDGGKPDEERVAATPVLGSEEAAVAPLVDTGAKDKCTPTPTSPRRALAAATAFFDAPEPDEEVDYEVDDDEIQVVLPPPHSGNDFRSTSTGTSTSITSSSSSNSSSSIASSSSSSIASSSSSSSSSSNSGISSGSASSSGGSNRGRGGASHSDTGRAQSQRPYPSPHLHWNSSNDTPNGGKGIDGRRGGGDDPAVVLRAEESRKTDVTAAAVADARLYRQRLMEPAPLATRPAAAPFRDSGVVVRSGCDLPPGAPPPLHPAPLALHHPTLPPQHDAGGGAGASRPEEKAGDGDTRTLGGRALSQAYALEVFGVERLEDAPWRKHDARFRDFFNYNHSEDSYLQAHENFRDNAPHHWPPPRSLGLLPHALDAPPRAVGGDDAAARYPPVGRVLRPSILSGKDARPFILTGEVPPRQPRLPSPPPPPPQAHAPDAAWSRPRREGTDYSPQRPVGHSRRGDGDGGGGGHPLAELAPYRTYNHAARPQWGGGPVGLPSGGGRRSRSRHSGRSKSNRPR